MKSQLTKFLGFKQEGAQTNGEEISQEQIKNVKKRDIEYLPVDKIIPNPYQPRIEFDEEELKELASSIKNHGIIQPLTVRKNSEDEYELIAGERRLRASKLIGLKEVPVIVGEFVEKEMAEIALIENLQRKDLDFLEEAVGYKKLLETFDLTQKELAEQIGKSQSTIANKLRLLKLSEEVQQLAKNPNITERHARALLKLPTEELQVSVIEQVIENEYTVREMEELIDGMLAEINGEEEDEDNINVVRYFNDVRLSLNTIRKTIRDIRDSGLEVEFEEVDEDDYVEVKIRLPKE
ncbi:MULTISPECIES: nucleoid occlusion protein [unclassified Candidatus Frackibacter]|uniref:nucleoid occlusion protein n=1 Tax=unclassified Candidatus Frackibacter TaxID=2648818 RepID=UPI000796C9E3|nr:MULTISPECIES: nucleoid occlusion protein [unclassified Candidatus Frackibacter]KXS44067.1 MAG: chromosome partitioning protein, ParB family [Candidatus Frackibacter sp. T328-2]SDC43884.1 chromosome partitioning protein, ParB family [Candidatus Frackibacter sp. WG11]SEM64216.1 chromosome partitioning protein, ParB family [Candidatus Frackibacter sp. WG12]SFL68527.1 chromosome partitioning protein, ParB family [Candidatus Frackibacter sp. WG13]